MSRVGGVRSPGRHHRDHAIEQCYTQTVLLTAHQIRTLDDGVVEEPASSPKVIEDRDAWLQSLAARAGDQEAPATPTAAAAAAAPTPESSNARSFFEGLLNSPGK